MHIVVFIMDPEQINKIMEYLKKQGRALKPGDDIPGRDNMTTRSAAEAKKRGIAGLNYIPANTI